MDPLIFIQVVGFVSLGIFAWALSYFFPLDSYLTKPVETFDKWFIFIALTLIAAHGLIFMPMIGGLVLTMSPVMMDGIDYIHHEIARQPSVLRVLEFILVADFFGYWAHRFLHSRQVWRFHAIHHSPTSVNWVSGVRGSPVHYIVILTPTAFSNYFFLHDSAFLPLALFMCFDMLNQQFCHSNIRLPFARQLEYVFVTPRMHLVHHNPIVRYTNTNYGLYFTFWDRLFGTYVDEDKVDPVCRGMMGIDYNESKWSLFLGLQKRGEKLYKDIEESLSVDKK